MTTPPSNLYQDIIVELLKTKGKVLKAAGENQQDLPGTDYLKDKQQSSPKQSQAPKELRQKNCPPGPHGVLQGEKQKQKTKNEEEQGTMEHTFNASSREDGAIR